VTLPLDGQPSPFRTLQSNRHNLINWQGAALLQGRAQRLAFDVLQHHEGRGRVGPAILGLGYFEDNVVPGVPVERADLVRFWTQSPMAYRIRSVVSAVAIGHDVDVDVAGQAQQVLDH
jgi:hypothetical protein